MWSVQTETLSPIRKVFSLHHELHEPCRWWYSSPNSCYCSRTSACRSLSISLLMSGLFAGFLSNGPLELFRTLALNRRRFMTHSHLYSSTKKTLPAHFAGRQKSWPRPELNSEEKGRFNGPWLLPSPCTLPIVLRWPCTQHRPPPVWWWAG